MKSTVAMRAIGAVLVGTLITMHTPGLAQSSTFAVTTIRRNLSGSTSGGVDLQPGGRLAVTNTAPRDMLRFALNLPDSAVVGGPDWLASERYDIVASVARDVTREEAARMLRALVIERFQLRLREDTREEPMYVLVTLDAGGRPGPRLTPTKTDCAAAEREGTSPCRFDLGGGSITAHGRPISRLVRALGGLTGRIVVDKTGLTGDYDMELTWAPEQTDAGPSLLIALEEQLGLKLENTLGPVPVVVIESAERPVEQSR